MRVSRNHGGAICFGHVKEGLLIGDQPNRDEIDFLAQPKTQVCRDLVVTAAARVQLAAGVTNHLNQTRLDERMHIFGDHLVKINTIGAPSFENGAEGRPDLL